MDYKNNYEMWLNSPYFDEQTKNELLSIKDDEKEIQIVIKNQVDNILKNKNKEYRIKKI